MPYSLPKSALSFLHNESGATPVVEWTVVAAAVAFIGLGASSAVRNGIGGLAPDGYVSTGGDTGGGGGNGGNGGGNGGNGGGNDKDECIDEFYDLTYYTDARSGTGAAIDESLSRVTDDQLLADYRALLDGMTTLAVNPDAYSTDTRLVQLDTSYIYWQEIEARGILLDDTYSDFLELAKLVDADAIQGGGAACENGNSGHDGGPRVDEGTIDISGYETGTGDYQPLAYSSTDFETIYNTFVRSTDAQRAQYFEEYKNVYASGQETRNTDSMMQALDVMYAIYLAAKQAGDPGADEYYKTYQDGLEYYSFIAGERR